jgi:hypothetical protein
MLGMMLKGQKIQCTSLELEISSVALSKMQNAFGQIRTGDLSRVRRTD